jgi:hypothetical protein
MRMRIAVVALVVVLFPSPAFAADPPPSCARADALLTAGYLDDAATVYKQMLPDTCAVQGKSGIERVDEARKARFDALVATVRRLEGEGFDDEARKQAQAIVEEFDTPLPDDVRSLLSGSRGGVSGWEPSSPWRERSSRSSPCSSGSSYSRWCRFGRSATCGRARTRASS